MDTPTGLGVAVDGTALGVRDEFLLSKGACFKKEPRVRLMPDSLGRTWPLVSPWLRVGAVWMQNKLNNEI